LLCPSCGANAAQTSTFCPRCGAALLEQAELDSRIGQTVAKKFRIEKLIGEGGMGKVYRARLVALDKPVVLKVLRRALLADRQTVARFRREAQAASRLSHPNSINVIDIGETEGGEQYIAMELVDGKDLQQVLSTEWPLPEARVIRIVSQILSALSEAHAAGIIHRDLKPENIMVQQLRKEPDFVKVLDFGIAKIVDPSLETGPITRAGFVCGTPEYMSPEQARGGDLDARSDLYAVGVLLYQLTTGLLPFVANSGASFAAKHLTETPIAPSRRRPGLTLSAGLERLILKALSKDPAARPQTAEEFRQALLAVGDGARSSEARAVEVRANPLGAVNPSAERRFAEAFDPAVRRVGVGWRTFQLVTLLLCSVALGLGYGLYRSSVSINPTPSAWPANAPVPERTHSARR
jgi:serine/threonine-protein kinase